MRRIVIKLSGEAFADNEGFSVPRADEAARVIIRLMDMGIEPAIVPGGGNIIRGRSTDGMDRVSADQMGMLATVINGLFLKDAIIRAGGRAEVFSAAEMNRYTRLYTRDAADEFLTAGGAAILAGGSGNPFFSTDTAAALRAGELNACAIYKGTTVEGIFDADPRNHKGAKLLKEVTYADAIRLGLKIMDITAFTLCLERGIPEIRVFNMDDLENIIKVAAGESVGSVAHP